MLRNNNIGPASEAPPYW